MKNKLKVNLKFKTTLPELVKKFLFCTDRLDKYTDYVIEVDTPTENKGLLTPNQLTDKGWKLLRSNLIDTENPHKQMRKMIIIDFYIYNISRAVLQEWSKHQIGVATVAKSTRYSLNKIKNDKRIPNLVTKEFDNKLDIEKIVNDYYYIPTDFQEKYEKNIWINHRFVELTTIKYQKIANNLSNDRLKKYVNDFMLTNITGIISGEALHNLLTQRLDTYAFYQFQELAKEIYRQIPDQWKEFFKVYKYKKVDKNLVEKINLVK